MNSYLVQAIELALDNVQDGGTPYGAVLVQGDLVVGTGVNTMHEAFDISGHAEMIAIKEAQARLQTNDLSDCVMYTSGHPCPMCLGAIGMTGIQNVVYANTLEEASQYGFGLSLDIYQYLKGDKQALNLNITHIGIKDDAQNPMLAYKAVNQK